MWKKGRSEIWEKTRFSFLLFPPSFLFCSFIFLFSFSLFYCLFLLSSLYLPDSDSHRYRWDSTSGNSGSRILPGRHRVRRISPHCQRSLENDWKSEYPRGLARKMVRNIAKVHSVKLQRIDFESISVGSAMKSGYPFPRTFSRDNCYREFPFRILFSKKMHTVCPEFLLL